jgi:hypothetical protein
MPEIIAMRHQDVLGLAGIVSVFGLPFLGMMLWMLVHYCSATFKAWHETSLKRDMIARGYTVEEIVAVVSARRGCKSAKQSPMASVPPAKPVRQPTYSG